MSHHVCFFHVPSFSVAGVIVKNCVLILWPLLSHTLTLCESLKHDCHYSDDQSCDDHWHVFSKWLGNRIVIMIHPCMNGYIDYINVHRHMNNMSKQSINKYRYLPSFIILFIHHISSKSVFLFFLLPSSTSRARPWSSCSFCGSTGSNGCPFRRCLSWQMRRLRGPKSVFFCSETKGFNRNSTINNQDWMGFNGI